MNSNKILKEKAIRLRKEGLSYREIKQKIGVSKSTLSGWLKVVELTPKQKERLYTKQIAILSLGPQSQKERREREVKNIINNAKNEVKLPLSFETQMLFGAAIYWAEGNKKNGFAITNSDPDLVLLMVKWFEKILGVGVDRLDVRLNIYEQQNEQDLKKFWSQLTGVPLENFGKSFVKPANKGYKKNNLYYGTIKIRVKKGEDFRHRIYGWIRSVLQDITQESELAQNEWKSLREVQRPVNLNIS